MPDARSRRKAPEIPVPAKGEDAAERKRVLNVLAQRRYRQRRREHVKKLEAHVGTPNPGQRSESLEETCSDASADTTASQVPDLMTSLPTGSSDTVQLSDLERPTYQQGQPEFDPFAEYDPNFVTAIQGDWDLLLPSLPGTPFSADNSPSDIDCQALSLTSSPGSSRSADTPWTFPDEDNFKIIELDTMRASVAIAVRLNVNHLIWSLDSKSPFTDPGTALANFDHLPWNLKPTKTQMTIPHHPMIDLLPWPKVRDRFILILSQPKELRPPAAASSTVLSELVTDFDDTAEGMRVSGKDPYSEQSWEVGEAVFKNWWWAFDSDVIRRSNEMRKSRGARLLGEGSVLGEVQ